MEPDWVRHAIWWHVYPLGFVGADRAQPPGSPRAPARPARRLARLRRRARCVRLALGPVFASSTHGYDTVDHFRIDPRLGDDADFARWSPPRTTAACGCCSTGCSTTSGGSSAFARRSVDATAGRPGGGVVPAAARRGRRVGDVRGPRRAGGAEPRRARGRRHVVARDGPLARPRAPTAGAWTPPTPCHRRSGRRSAPGAGPAPRRLGRRAR